MTTQYANAMYQEVIDLHTESNTVSVLGIHSPCTDTPVKMLKGFWEQFRKFRYNGCSISLVPAARLPADPLQVSYSAGEATIDPRDMLNPIMFHGCHGNDMGAILNSLYSGQTATTDIARQFSDSIEQNVFNADLVGNDFVEALYYKALTDNTWKKAHPQQGFRKNGLRPMVHNVVANVPYGTRSSGTRELYPLASSPSGVIDSAETPGLMETEEGDAIVLSTVGDWSGVTWMTAGIRPMGWQDTHSMHNPDWSAEVNGNASADATAIGTAIAGSEVLNTVDKAFMGMIMLPPAYKTEQYYRLIINHSISFKGFRGASMMNATAQEVNNAPSVYNFN